MDQVRTVIIGFGGMGRQYARMIYDGKVRGMALAGICCKNSEGQAYIRERYPQIGLYESVEDAFHHDKDFDAVVIVTPHDTHVPIGKLAFSNGKHVLSDKPAGISTKEVRELLAQAGSSGKSYGLMFNNRMKEAYQKAGEMITSGAVGRLTRVVWVCNNWFRTAAYHRSAPWRSTWRGEHGGLLINQCQHNLDIWQWLFGMPQAVYAHLEYGKYNELRVDDGAVIQFFYDNGLHGTFISSTGENPGVNRLEIWGTKGKLCIEDQEFLTFDENRVSTQEFSRVNTDIYGKLEHQMREIPTSRGESGYVPVLRNFADHIRDGAPLYADGTDGLNALMLANASYLSSWLDKKVALPIDDELYANMLRKKEEEE